MEMQPAAAVAFASVFVLGICFAILGSIKLRLAEKLDIDDEKAGSLISALMFSSMIMILIIGPLQDFLGYKPIAIVGFAAAGICLWLLAAAPSYGAALGACLLLGVGAMCVNTSGNTLAPQVMFGGDNPNAALNLNNVFFGLGAFLTPLLVGKLIKKLGYKTAVSAFGAICVVPILWAIPMSYPETQGFAFADYINWITHPAVLVGGIALFCYIGLESSMGGFITTYLKDAGYEEDSAGNWLSGFWISLMIARVVAALILSQVDVPGGAVITGLAILAIVAIGIMVTAETKKAGALGTILAGLSFGPIFPTIVGVTYGKSAASGSVFGLIFAIGLLGGVTVPYLIGRYSARLTIRKSLKIALGVAVLLTVINLSLWLVVPAA